MADLAETSHEFRERGGDMKGGSMVDVPLAEYMGGVKARVNEGIEEYVSHAPEALQGIFDHALTGEMAARIRPALTYMTGDTFDIPRDELDGLAIATDLIHTASLILDDLPSQDNSDLRRGKPAAHVKFGVGPAELASLHMLFDTEAIIVSTDISADNKVRLADYIADMKKDMINGQLLDLQTFGQPIDEVPVGKLDEISRLKTSGAIEMGIVGAAIIGGLPDDIIDILKKYSYHAGIAYQAKDDLRDVSETSERLGKTAGIDAVNQKPTYIDLLGEEGTKQKITEHVEAANAALDELPDDCNPVKFREILAYFANK